MEAGIPSRWSMVDTLSKWIPNTTGLMSWTIGDHGFRMTLDPLVPNMIESHLERELTAWLELNSLSLADIDVWAIHPGGPRIIQAVGNALHLPSQSLECSKSILASHGNMSSPTVLFILDKLSKEQPTANHCILLAFGPGLCIEAVLLKSNVAQLAGSDRLFLD
jgi:predicted naringenin-chalcone synthase